MFGIRPCSSRYIPVQAYVALATYREYYAHVLARNTRLYWSPWRSRCRHSYSCRQTCHRKRNPSRSAFPRVWRLFTPYNRARRRGACLGEPHNESLGVQVWWDLLFAVGIALFFTAPRARKVGMSMLPWTLFVAATASIGLLAMIARLFWLEGRSETAS